MTIKLIDPANGEKWQEIPTHNFNEIEEIVQLAEQIFRNTWQQVNSRDRCRLLLNLAGLIREHKEELAQLESRNVGKPIRDARDEIDLAANCFEYYAGTTNKVGGETIPVASSGLSMTLREPMGVCALIIPWNYPLVITSWKVAPALAMGNTVVVKPASLTPLTALKLQELALKAGFPEGVFNVVIGSGAEVGESLISHPLIKKISFTGSTEIGTKVMQLAANDIKNITLELGGKSANIIFADADWDKALNSAIWSVFSNTGQDCCARSRLLIEQSIYDDFIQDLSEKIKNLRLGNPLDENTEIGPLISFNHRDRVLKYIDLGIQEGAKLICGGNIPTAENLQTGAYLQPALFADVEPSMKIAQEEIFGPVLCAISFTNEQEAIDIANNSLYGLSGSIWTKDITRALTVAQAVETGVLSINTGSSVHLEAPFGGVKMSGIGRELGLKVLDHYTNLKSLFIAL
jgi:betaine-aldehyde dehydrogenase